MRRRPALLIAAGFGVFVFLGLSFLLARGLTGSSTERGRVLEVLEAQARGDARALLAEHPALADPPHRDRARRLARGEEPARGAVRPGAARGAADGSRRDAARALGPDRAREGLLRRVSAP